MFMENKKVLKLTDFQKNEENPFMKQAIEGIENHVVEQLEALRHHFPNISKAMEEGKDLLKQITRSRGFGMGM
ncbi:hypothetical protein GAO41_31480 [Bacteroides thetaiotaomicron]|nr:hypothetical protein GAO41_31480 [Bacteroides thetaiotaomicron]